MNEWTAWVPSAVLAPVVLTLMIALVRLRRQVASLEAEVSRRPQSAGGGFETLASASSSTTAPLVEEVAQQPSRNPVSHVATYVITGIAESEADVEPDRRIEGSLFADLVLRESVVKGVSLVYGVRRALAPETRNRIRFVMRQEVKRSRKQRRVDLRAARRHLADLQREDAA